MSRWDTVHEDQTDVPEGQVRINPPEVGRPTFILPDHDRSERMIALLRRTGREDLLEAVDWLMGVGEKALPNHG